MRSKLTAPLATFTVLMLTTGLVSPTTANAAADNNTVGSTVASARTFPARTAAKQSLLAESAAVTASSNASWGGVENLDIPKTKSQAEIEQEAQAQREEEAAQQRARQAALEASRSQARQNIDSVPASANGKAVVEYALQYVGSPYVYGGTTPAGWDCSGFTSYVFAHFGIRLSHASSEQRGVGQRVSQQDAQPGDLMWKPGHVGIYLGNGMMVHASTPRTGTIVASASYANFEYYRLA